MVLVLIHIRLEVLLDYTGWLHSLLDSELFWVLWEGLQVTRPDHFLALTLIALPRLEGRIGPGSTGSGREAMAPALERLETRPLSCHRYAKVRYAKVRYAKVDFSSICEPYAPDSPRPFPQGTTPFAALERYAEAMLRPGELGTPTKTLYSS